VATKLTDLNPIDYAIWSIFAKVVAKICSRHVATKLTDLNPIDYAIWSIFAKVVAKIYCHVFTPHSVYIMYSTSVNERQKFEHL